MKKIAFRMNLYPGNKEEYKRRHNLIWPELKALLKKNGVSDYSIYLDEETNLIFAVQYCADGAMPVNSDPIIQKWWDYMADLMETHQDNSPVLKPLELIFHMD